MKTDQDRERNEAREAAKIIFPVYYLSDDNAIYDADNNWICDVDNPLLIDNLVHEDFQALIDVRGRYVVEAMNHYAARSAQQAEMPDRTQLFNEAVAFHDNRLAGSEAAIAVNLIYEFAWKKLAQQADELAAVREQLAEAESILFELDCGSPDDAQRDAGIYYVRWIHSEDGPGGPAWQSAIKSKLEQETKSNVEK